MSTRQEMRERLAGELRDEGYKIDLGDLLTMPDPICEGVWAVRVWPVRVEEVVPQDFIVHLNDESGDRVEPVEFKSWPPRASY